MNDLRGRQTCDLEYAPRSYQVNVPTSMSTTSAVPHALDQPGSEVLSTVLSTTTPGHFQ